MASAVSYVTLVIRGEGGGGRGRRIVELDCSIY